MFVNKTLLSPLKIGLVSDAADVSLWVPVSMESFHDVSIQTVKKSHSPLSQPRVQDHGELLSARLSPGNHYKFQWAYADEMRNFPRVHSYDPFVTTINQRKNEKWMSLCCISFFYWTDTLAQVTHTSEASKQMLYQMEIGTWFLLKAWCLFCCLEWVWLDRMWVTPWADVLEHLHQISIYNRISARKGFMFPVIFYPLDLIL